MRDPQVCIEEEARQKNEKGGQDDGKVKYQHAAAEVQQQGEVKQGPKDADVKQQPKIAPKPKT